MITIITTTSAGIGAVLGHLFLWTGLRFEGSEGLSVCGSHGHACSGSLGLSLYSPAELGVLRKQDGSSTWPRRSHHDDDLHRLICAACKERGLVPSTWVRFGYKSSWYPCYPLLVKSSFRFLSDYGVKGFARECWMGCKVYLSAIAGGVPCKATSGRLYRLHGCHDVPDMVSKFCDLENSLASMQYT